MILFKVTALSGSVNLSWIRAELGPLVKVKASYPQLKLG